MRSQTGIRRCRWQAARWACCASGHGSTASSQLRGRAQQAGRTCASSCGAAPATSTSRRWAAGSAGERGRGMPENQALGSQQAGAASVIPNGARACAPHGPLPAPSWLPSACSMAACSTSGGSRAGVRRATSTRVRSAAGPLDPTRCSTSLPAAGGRAGGRRSLGSSAGSRVKPGCQQRQGRWSHQRASRHLRAHMQAK